MRIPAPPFLACVICIFLALTGIVQSQGVQHIKTSYKHYSIFSYQGRDVLCEPYIVKKNEWLYKIFRQKGEISEHNFPFFIAIFKQINPHIQNIDAIAPGTRILIPLKITRKQDYTVDKDGRVQIPVVEFHNTVESPESHVSKYSIQEPTLSYQSNSHIKDTRRLLPGDRIKIPAPSVQNIPSRQPPTAVDSEQLQRLQEYADAINGKLIHQGKLYFPGKNGRKQVQLDLSSTPVIEMDDPQKTVMILSNPSPQNPLQNEETRQTISSYWRHVKIQPIETILHNRAPVLPGSGSPSLRYHLSRQQIFQILEQTGYVYVPEESFRFHVNQIPVSARLDRVKIPDRPDLLLNFGRVYGRGIDALRQLEFDVVTFTLMQNWQEQIRQLLSALGYQVWENPSFTHQGTVKMLAGIYGEQSSSRLFISSSPVIPLVRSFLETRQIQHICLQP